MLIIFVVFIHNNPTEIHFADGTEVYRIPEYVRIVRDLISGIIAAVAVPLFFFISGYLVYAKETKFFTLLKKKSQTLLVPYMVWHILALLFFFIAQSFSFTKPYFANIIIKNFSVLDWIGAFTGKSGIFGVTGFPLVYQFWFLRDLFILNMLGIGIKKLIDRFPLGTVMVFLIVWISNINIYLVSTAALFFFALGYYGVKYAWNCEKLDAVKMYDLSILYLITIVLELFFTPQVPMIHTINIILGSIFFVKLTYYFIRNEKLYKRLDGLEKYAFFVYAVHGLLLAIIQKLSVKIIPMHDGWLLLQYFGVTSIGIILFVLLGAGIKQCFPKIYALLTGGRI